MKPVLKAVLLVAIFIGSDGLTQGHPDANPTETIKIQRSSEFEVESKTFEKRVPVKLEYDSGSCKAELRIEYLQKNTDAHVKSDLSNEDCGASSGKYRIRIRYKDAEGELGLLEFEETWDRDDNVTVTSEKDYFVGDDIDIIRVNTRGLSCSCKEPSRESEEPLS